MAACIAGSQLENSRSNFRSEYLCSLKLNPTFHARPVVRSLVKAEAPSVASAEADRNLDNPRTANGVKIVGVMQAFWDEFGQSPQSFLSHFDRTHKSTIDTKPIAAHKDQDDLDEVWSLIKAEARSVASDALAVILSQKSPCDLILPADCNLVKPMGALALIDKARLSVSSLASKAHYTGPGVCPVNRDGSNGEGRKWYLDTGATVHVCHSRDEFDEYIAVHGPPVATANNSPAAVIGFGTVKLSFPFGQVVTLKEVLHVPTINKCLVSMIKLEDDGFGIRIESGEVVIYSKCSNIDEDGFSMHLGEEEVHFRGRKFAGYGIREDGMYRLCLPDQLPA